MQIAQAIAVASSADAAWDLIRASRDSFLWTDDEEPVDTWNRIASSSGVKGTMRLEWDKDDHMHLNFGGRALFVATVDDRDDRFILIHAIATLGAEVMEIRYCKASSHSSDQAYLPCPPAVWEELETDVGALKLSTQFLEIDPDLKEFAKALYSPNEPPKWAR